MVHTTYEFIVYFNHPGIYIITYTLDSDTFEILPIS